MQQSPSGQPPYRGRFAPSPTGELHLGSLAAALASYLQTRRHQGVWSIRIDDIDTARVKPGSADNILSSLSELGLEPDEPVRYQSQRLARYAEAVAQLLASGAAFPCGCSRADLAADGSYPGTCRDGLPAGRQPRSVRVRAPRHAISFTDRVAGSQSQNIRRQGGDFIIRRADGIFAYQLCAAVDDAWPDVTEVVRGADLLPSTGRQRYLQHLLGLSSPDYAHVPVLLGKDGNKLSKRRGDDPLHRQRPALAMRSVLTHLAHPPPAAIDSVTGLLEWAVRHWDIHRLRHGSALPAG